MNLVTMKDYIYATPAKVLENVKNAEMLVKPIVDLYIKKNYKKITFVLLDLVILLSNVQEDFFVKS